MRNKILIWLVVLLPLLGIGAVVGKMDGLFVAAHTTDSDDIPFGDASHSGFLPEREPGEYRVIWEGYARPTDSNEHVSEGCLIATFTLE